MTLDTDMAGDRQAFIPAGPVLAALSACTIRCIERVTPILKFSLRGVEVHLHGVRQDLPSRMISIFYEIVVDTDEPDRRLDLFHDSVRKYGTVFIAFATGTELSGVLHRKASP